MLASVRAVDTHDVHRYKKLKAEGKARAGSLKIAAPAVRAHSAWLGGSIVAKMPGGRQPAACFHAAFECVLIPSVAYLWMSWLRFKHNACLVWFQCNLYAIHAYARTGYDEQIVTVAEYEEVGPDSVHRHNLLADDSAR